MAKRSASTELNKDNCDIDDPPEEAGFFQSASEETMKKRVIRTARRRCTGIAQSGEGVKNVFAGFAGFAQGSSAPKPSFSFLSSTSTAPLSSTSTGSNGTDDKPKASNVSTPVNGTLSDSPTKQTKDKEYYSKLKGLNESVSRWISTHVAKNPLCILTPVFRDYEKHLQSIENERKKETSSSSEDTEVDEKDKGSDAVIGSKKDDTKTNKESVKSDSKEESKSPSWTSATTSTAFGSSFKTGTPSTISQYFKQEDKGKPSATIFGGASSPPSATLSFGMSSNSSTPSAGFSFGSTSAKPFSFSNVSKPETSETADNDDEVEEPPKSDHKAVTEKGAVYEKRCKVFVKKDGQYVDRGVGILFLKPVCDGEKTQLVVRSDTSLGNVILNVLLSSGLPATRLGNNNVALVCVPTPDEKPPPTTVLLRVKTAEDADGLLAALEEHKK